MAGDTQRTKERDRERQRQRDRQRERERDRERDREREGMAMSKLTKDEKAAQSLLIAYVRVWAISTVRPK